MKRWEIYKANLDSVVGSEQGKSRPVVIISDDQVNNILKIVNVLPLTSLKSGRKIYPNECLVTKGSFGLNSDSIILCYQIRTLDKVRLSFKIGEINDATKQKRYN